MAKSRDAFRTISEVADWLDTPAHVLRFWESKFSQVKPVKRAGGRRYYRPSDMALLAGLKKLLHEDGLTIKGAQKVLREKGVKHVASLSTLSLDDDETEDVLADAAPSPAVDSEPPPAPDTVFDDVLIADETPAFAPVEPDAGVEDDRHQTAAFAADRLADDEFTPRPEVTEAPATAEQAEAGTDAPDEPADAEPAAEDTTTVEAATEEPAAEEPAAEELPSAPPAESPLFQRSPASEQEQVSDDGSVVPFTPAAIRAAEPEAPEEPVEPRSAPLGADIPPDADDDAITTEPGPLAHLAGLSKLSADHVARITPYLDALRARADNGP